MKKNRNHTRSRELGVGWNVQFVVQNSNTPYYDILLYTGFKNVLIVYFSFTTVNKTFEK